MPLLAAWFAVAIVVGTYRRPSVAGLIVPWAVGLPLGVLVRALALGRDLDGRQLAFLATTLAFSALFVLGLRALAGSVVRTREG